MWSFTLLISMPPSLWAKWRSEIALSIDTGVKSLNLKFLPVGANSESLNLKSTSRLQISTFCPYNGKRADQYKVVYSVVLEFKRQVTFGGFTLIHNFLQIELIRKYSVDMELDLNLTNVRDCFFFFFLFFFFFFFLEQNN